MMDTEILIDKLINPQSPYAYEYKENDAINEKSGGNWWDQIKFPDNFTKEPIDLKLIMLWLEQREYILGETFNFFQTEKELGSNSKFFYTQKVIGLPNIEAIVYEILSNSQHFMTILSKRDLETREKIYNIEMKMFDTFKNENFKFSVNYINKPDELYSMIKNKNVLFHKNPIYAEHK